MTTPIHPRRAATPLPLNLAEMMDLLLTVHGHQILVDGCFNGDPHPGEISSRGEGVWMDGWGEGRWMRTEEEEDGGGGGAVVDG